MRQLPLTNRRQHALALCALVANFLGLSLSAMAQTTAKTLATPSATEADFFKLGVIPNVSIRVLMNNYLPVRLHLQNELSQQVQIHTAADLKTYQAATVKGDYHAVVTAANLARVLELDHRWQPVAVFEPSIPGVLVRSKSKPPSGLSVLQSKRLALSNPQSLVALRGFDWLAEQGLKLGTDYTTAVLRNDDSLYLSLAEGDIPYAIMSMGEFRAIPEKYRAALEVETEFAKVMGFVVMAAPDTSAEKLARLRTIWLKLPSTSHGAGFAELAGVRNVKAVSSRDLASMDAYTKATRTGLAQ